MAFKFDHKVEITSCMRCPNHSNSTQEHDCAFTSAPYPSTDYCNHGLYRTMYGTRILHETNLYSTISEKCPERPEVIEYHNKRQFINTDLIKLTPTIQQLSNVKIAAYGELDSKTKEWQWDTAKLMRHFNYYELVDFYNYVCRNE